MKKCRWRNKWEHCTSAARLSALMASQTDSSLSSPLVSAIMASTVLFSILCSLIKPSVKSQADASGGLTTPQNPSHLAAITWQSSTADWLLGGQSCVSAQTAQPCRLRLPLETLCPWSSAQVIWSWNCRSTEPFLCLCLTPKVASCLSVGHEWPLARAWVTRVTRLASARTLDSCRTGRVWNTFLPTDSLPWMSDSVSPFSNAMLITVLLLSISCWELHFYCFKLAQSIAKWRALTSPLKEKKLKTQSNTTTRLMLLHFDNPISHAS